MEKRVKIIIIILVIIIAVVVILCLIKYSRDEGLEGELAARKPKKDKTFVSSAEEEEEVECHWCEEVLMDGSPDYCLDSGKQVCADGRCLVKANPPFTLDPCLCSETCDTCTEICTDMSGIGGGSPDYKCVDTGKELCNDIGPCVDDEDSNGNGIPDDCECDDMDTRSGCGSCEECDAGTCESIDAPAGNATLCPDGTCVIPEIPITDCPEFCAPACDSCTEICKYGLYCETRQVPGKRCSDGECVDIDEKCSIVEI